MEFNQWYHRASHESTKKEVNFSVIEPTYNYIAGWFETISLTPNANHVQFLEKKFCTVGLWKFQCVVLVNFRNFFIFLGGGGGGEV